MQIIDKTQPQAIQVVNGTAAPAFRTIDDAIDEAREQQITRLVEALEGESKWERQEDELGEPLWEIDACSPSLTVVYTLRYRPSDNGYALLCLCLDEEEETVLCESYPGREAALRGLASQLLADASISARAMEELRDMHPLFGTEFL